ncbi:WD40 repeat domain-containing protein [Candidatus Babeliales bacterium]|nr:WD40 repeat domain-containing protein [Candidatus Babeliales bacterium]
MKNKKTLLFFISILSLPFYFTKLIGNDDEYIPPNPQQFIKFNLYKRTAKIKYHTSEFVHKNSVIEYKDFLFYKLFKYTAMDLFDKKLHDSLKKETFKTANNPNNILKKHITIIYNVFRKEKKSIFYKSKKIIQTLEIIKKLEPNFCYNHFLNLVEQKIINSIMNLIIELKLGSISKNSSNNSFSENEEIIDYFTEKFKLKNISLENEFTQNQNNNVLDDVSLNNLTYLLTGKRHILNKTHKPIKKILQNYILKKYSKSLSKALIIKKFKGHKGKIYKVVTLPNGNIATASEDKSIKIWNLKGKLVKSIKKAHKKTPIVSLMLHPNGNLVSGCNLRIRIWNHEKYNFINGYRFQNEDTIKHFDFFENSQFLAIAINKIGAIYDLTIPHTSISVFIGHTSLITGIKVMENDNIITSSEDGTLQIWDIGGNCIKSLNIEKAITCFTFLDDKTVIVGCSDGIVQILDIEYETYKKIFIGHRDEITDIKILKNNQIATSSKDKTIKIWDIYTSKCITTLTGHNDIVSSISIFPNDFIASVSWDKNIIIWAPIPNDLFQLILILKLQGLLDTKQKIKLDEDWYQIYKTLPKYFKKKYKSIVKNKKIMKKLINEFKQLKI